jgi:hypothetical protein
LRRIEVVVVVESGGSGESGPMKRLLQLCKLRS